ncbi:hypothetical protein SynMVIR181_01007 [Synechococcus sp. MVIR-18-1]|nr:hypothetical protein SynMVIR181_01007 [Synechococcus sp. MVIR-18-1]
MSAEWLACAAVARCSRQFQLWCIKSYKFTVRGGLLGAMSLADTLILEISFYLFSAQSFQVSDGI